MNGFAVFQYEDSQESRFDGDISPATNPPIGLSLFSNRLLDGGENPFVQDALTVGTLSNVPKILGGFQSDRPRRGRDTTIVPPPSEIFQRECPSQLRRIPHPCRLDLGYNPGYTFTVKTAVSIPDVIFDAAELAAQRLDVSRSELYARALEAYLKTQSDQDVTRRLNEVYARESSSVDPPLHRAAVRSLGVEPW